VIQVLIIGLDAANFMLALLLVALGLVIIFGLMNVINMAHGDSSSASSSSG
jgi:branched-chain amino acid transport system permease protein/urea transport system permease protein